MRRFAKEKVLELTEIKATFIGEDGSCGFRKGQSYKLWRFRKNGKIYISRRSMTAMAIPYDTIEAVRKNWREEKS